MVVIIHGSKTVIVGRSGRIIKMGCPECGNSDLEIVRIDRKDHLYGITTGAFSSANSGDIGLQCTKCKVKYYGSDAIISLSERISFHKFSPKPFKVIEDPSLYTWNMGKWFDKVEYERCLNCGQYNLGYIEMHKISILNRTKLGEKLMLMCLNDKCRAYYNLKKNPQLNNCDQKKPKVKSFTDEDLDKIQIVKRSGIFKMNKCEKCNQYNFEYVYQSTLRIEFEISEDILNTKKILLECLNYGCQNRLEVDNNELPNNINWENDSDHKIKSMTLEELENDIITERGNGIIDYQCRICDNYTYQYVLSKKQKEMLGLVTENQDKQYRIACNNCQTLLEVPSSKNKFSESIDYSVDIPIGKKLNLRQYITKTNNFKILQQSNIKNKKPAAKVFRTPKYTISDVIIKSIVSIIVIFLFLLILNVITKLEGNYVLLFIGIAAVMGYFFTLKTKFRPEILIDQNQLLITKGVHINEIKSGLEPQLKIVYDKRKSTLLFFKKYDSSTSVDEIKIFDLVGDEMKAEFLNSLYYYKHIYIPIFPEI